MRSSIISRRALMGRATAFGVASLAARPRHGLAAPATAIPERFDVFLRAHQNGDDTVSQFWYSGLVFGCPIGAQSKPMLSVQGFSHQRAKLLPDGNMQLTMAEVGYYGDPKTGEFVDEIVNIFTDKTIRPHHYKSRQDTLVGPDGAYSSSRIGQIPGSVFSGQLTAPIHSGNYVFFSENLETLLPNPKPDLPGRGLTSLANYTVLKGDLERRTGWVPLVFDYSSIGPWSDWLEMGGMAGVQNMRLSGRKMRPQEQPPNALKARIGRDHPGFIEDAGI